MWPCLAGWVDAPTTAMEPGLRIASMSGRGTDGLSISGPFVAQGWGGVKEGTPARESTFPLRGDYGGGDIELWWWFMGFGWFVEGEGGDGRSESVGQGGG